MPTSKTLWTGMMVLFAAAVVCRADIQPPTVRIVSPVDNQVFAADFTAKVDATDDVKVTKVDFSLENGKYLGTDSKAPFTFQVSIAGLTEGYHSLGARAFDAAGNSDFRYVSFYVALSTAVTRCQSMVVAVRNRTDNPLSANGWGTKGDLGSAGGPTVAPGSQETFTIPADPRLPEEGPYGLHIQAYQYTPVSQSAGCDADIPVVNSCPSIGIDAVVTLTQNKAGSLACSINAR